jgi:polygalacturonase
MFSVVFTASRGTGELVCCTLTVLPLLIMPAALVKGPLSVRWFGARGDGLSNDTTAIQNAIFSGSTICFPPGRYRLTHAIRAEVDHLALRGDAGAVLLVDPPVDEPFPEAILVNKGDAVPLGEVHHVTIQGLTFEVMNGASGLISAGVIQLNNCKDCSVRNVVIRYTGPTPKPENIDGIATSQGTSGLIEGCLVDGIPKAGIYASTGTRDLRIESCEVRNTTGPVGQVGISIGGAERVTVVNCLSHQWRRRTVYRCRR